MSLQEIPTLGKDEYILFENGKKEGGITMRINGQNFPEIDKLLNSGKKIQLEFDKKRQELRFFEVSVKKIKIEEEKENEV